MSVTRANLLYRRYTHGRRLQPEEPVFAGKDYWCDSVMVCLSVDTTAGELASVSASEAVYVVEQDTEEPGE